jgi:probable rRNA maturation factor
MSAAIVANVTVEVESLTNAGIDETFVEQVLSRAGTEMGQAGEVSVTFVSDEEIHALNLEYRGVDRPTDVLSFSQLEGEQELAFPDGVPALLGDIVISVPTALHQAEEYGHTLQREVAFLLVHGFLHLIGYDHQDEESEQEMIRIQESVLGNLGLAREVSDE